MLLLLPLLLLLLHLILQAHMCMSTPGMPPLQAHMHACLHLLLLPLWAHTCMHVCTCCFPRCRHMHACSLRTAAAPCCRHGLAYVLLKEGLPVLLYGLEQAQAAQAVEVEGGAGANVPLWHAGYNKSSEMYLFIKTMLR